MRRSVVRLRAALRHPAFKVSARLALVAAVVVLAWFLSHLIPRRGHFAERRGTMEAAVVGALVTDRAGFVSQPVTVRSTTGLTVDFRVLRPQAPPARVPLVILLGGHRTGRDAIDVVGDPGSIAVAALDYPYRGPERLRGVWQSLGSVQPIQQGLLDTPPAISVALDWLIAQPWVDPERVELMGVSLGVPFAAVAGALDSRFRRVWLVHGGLGNRAWLAHRLETRIANAPLRHAAAGLVHLLAHGNSFRTEEWARQIAPRPLVIIGAREDEQLPRDRVEGLYAAVNEPKELLWSEGGHVRTDRVDIVRQLLTLVRTRIESTPGPLSAAPPGPSR